MQGNYARMYLKGFHFYGASCGFSCLKHFHGSFSRDGVEYEMCFFLTLSCLAFLMEVWEDWEGFAVASAGVVSVGVIL